MVRQPVKLFTLLASVVTLLLLTISVLWFNSRHVGLLLDHVDEPVAFFRAWQAMVDFHADMQHPAMIHYLPSGCLCPFLTSSHALNLSNTAKNAGYGVYQLGTPRIGFGEELLAAIGPAALQTPGPLIAFTDEDGQIRYLGAYSDGIRCTESTSLVDEFARDFMSLPETAQLVLDRRTCVCSSKSP